MCTANQLKQVLDIVSETSKEIFEENLESVILYGSYARGDYDDESDIDIMILVNMNANNLIEFRTQINKLCSSLLYDYGVVVSIIEKDTETFTRYSGILPFYQNIIKEGIKIA